MDPVTSLVTGHIAGKAMECVGTQFKTNVIERWTRRRSEKFFFEFCYEVELELSGIESSKLDDMLSHMIEDETCSEVLFDAYRRVSLTKSKDIGPRIIGIVTAQLVKQERVADEIDDAILIAAEKLTDEELLEYAKFVREQKDLAADETRKDVVFTENGGLKIKWYDEQFDSNCRQESEVSIGPLDLDQYLGRWASKLESYGILYRDMKERQWDYEADYEYVDQGGSVREISWWLQIPQAYYRLAELIDRVSKGMAVAL